MADHVGELDDGYASLELFYYKGVAQIIDFGAFDAGNAEVAVDGSSDVADQERIAGLGDKEGSILGFGALTDIALNGGLGGGV